MKLKIFIIALVFSVFIIQVQAQTETKTFRGFLNGKRIQMTLTRDSGKLSGTYFYTKYGTNLMLELSKDNFRLLDCRVKKSDGRNVRRRLDKTRREREGGKFRKLEFNK